MRAQLFQRAARASMLIAAIAFAAACANESAEREDRCNTVNQAVSSCFGKGAPLFDCSVVSDADLDAANALANGPACQLAGEAPIDGDPESASCRLYGIDFVKSIQTAARTFGIDRKSTRLNS